jgi:glycosyltransferase involved in cell wall biosynthesis
VIVDGQSTDGTIETIKDIRPDAKIIIEKPGGKGKALKTGFENSSGDLIVMMDADGSNDPGEMRQLIEPLLDGYEVSKGSRMLPGGGSDDMTLFRKFGNSIFVGLVNTIYGANYTDLCYGYRAFKREALEELKCNSSGFEIETQQSIRIRKAGLKVIEVPSFEARRIHGESNLNSFKDGWRILNVIAGEYLKKAEPERIYVDAAISKMESTDDKFKSSNNQMHE